jgi:hypothetical protein
MGLGVLEDTKLVPVPGMRRLLIISINQIRIPRLITGVRRMIAHAATAIELRRRRRLCNVHLVDTFPSQVLQLWTIFSGKPQQSMSRVERLSNVRLAATSSSSHNLATAQTTHW